MYHEWERLDQGDADCLNCDSKATWGNPECMNDKENKEKKQPEQPKSSASDRLPRETEKEKIKRQLYNLIDRVDKL